MMILAHAVPHLPKMGKMPFKITGHSYGATTSGMLAYLLKVHHNVQSVNTRFSPQKIGNPQFITSSNSHFPNDHFVVHNLDPIHKSPGNTIYDTYEQTHNMIWYLDCGPGDNEGCFVDCSVHRCDEILPLAAQFTFLADHARYLGKDLIFTEDLLKNTIAG